MINNNDKASSKDRTHSVVNDPPDKLANHYITICLKMLSMANIILYKGL